MQLKMKLTLVVLSAVSAAISFVSLFFGLWFSIGFTIVFAGYGVARSVRSGLDPLNDLPNAFRVFLSTLGANLLFRGSNFLVPSAGVWLTVGGFFLNDEFQRRALRSLREGRKGGSVAFLGIDGSGKSAHAEATKTWLEARGYRCKLVPFHRYLFVERLSRRTPVASGPPRPGKRNPLRPALSLIDNLLLLASTSAGSGIEGTVVIYDRFIWSTYVKYAGLGYPVRPISFLYLLARPKKAIVFDVPVEKSLRVIDEREVHIRYSRRVLTAERDVYLRLAAERGYPVIDSTLEFGRAQEQVEASLSKTFPTAGGRKI